MITVANASTGNTSEDKQVRKQEYYDKGWQYILRPPKNIINGLVFYAEKLCDNDNVLYSQEKRYSLYNTLKQNKFDINCLTDKVYCDCSSFIGTCICGNGIDVNIGCFTTSTMRYELQKKGFQVINFNDSNQLQKGDILLKEGYHTILVLRSETEIIQDSMGTVKLNDINSFLNVREKPSTSAKVITTLRHGDKVKIIGQVDSWYKINTNGFDGYCSMQYII